MRTFRIGIIGCGVISNTYIADIQNFYHDLKIVALADVVVEIAVAQAEKYGIETACTPQELLADESIDLVINLTPPQFHTEVNRQIIAAGKHLFCEKPFAPDVESAREILRIAEEAGVKVGCAPDTFLSSGLMSVRYYLDAGLIGKPFFVTANMVEFGVETWHPNPFPYYKGIGSPMYDMAPYYISAIVALLGPVESVAAYSSRPNEKRHVYVGAHAGEDLVSEVDTHYSAIMKLRSGVTVNLNISRDVYASGLPMFEIYGDEGTLTYPDPNFGGGTPKVYRKEQLISPIYQKTAEAEARRKQFYELPELYPRIKDYSRGLGVLDLANAIESGIDHRTGRDMILHITEVIEGILTSARDGCFVTMQTSCDRPRAMRPGAAPGSPD